MDMKIRGVVLLARKAFVQEHFGEGAWERVLSSLPKADQAVFKGIVVQVGWYPFELGERLDRAIVDVLGKGNPQVFEDIGAKSARQNLSGVHKAFLTPGNPQAFLTQTGSIYGFYYNTGSRTYESTGPASGVMVTRDAETFSVADCLTIVGWHKEALKMIGAKNVTIVETHCRAKGDPQCRYELAWEM
jgi:uncharacterized protein (TIGR02265 family)